MKFLIKCYLIFILAVPYGLIKLTSIYNIKTPLSLVNYDYLDYHLSYLLFPFILLVIPKSKKAFHLSKRNILLFITISLFVIRNIYLIYFNDLKYLFYPDLIFSLLLGLIIYKTFKRYYNLYSFENFLNWIVLIHFIGILISIIFTLNKIEFRFNAQNLDVGTTGLIFGYIFLIKVVYFKMDIFAILSLLILVLSGSRFNLILIICLFLVHSFSNLKIWHLFLSMLVFFLVFSSSIELSERILSSFSEIEDVSSTDKTSAGGRLLSFIVGIQVLIENFMNVSFSSVNLVLLMNKYGYPTFPHSYFLISSIYFPILTVYILIKLFKRFYNYRNISNFFVLFTFIFYGGITFNYKVYALIFILLFINYNLDKSKNHEILNTQ